ncbi:hypothetical protein K8I28_05575 [bacterium]|nr:hypothetical protein [bacterium]
MMKIGKYISLIFVLFILLSLLTGCEDEKDNSAGPDPISGPEDINNDHSAESGNLLLSNYTADRLVLYAASEKINVIPGDASDFWVFIPNPTEGVVDMSIYKLDDIWEDLENPDANGEVFKRWSVPLSNDTEVQSSVTWFVNESTAGLTSGTLVLSYIGGTENFADIYLNNHTGAKVASLKPGDQFKRFAVEYGTYTLHYRYWFSDQNNQDFPVELGWRDKELVNGNETDIYLVLNNQRQERTIYVPHYEENIVDRYGDIIITNNRSVPVVIYVGQQLIEDIMYTQEPAQNMSTIGANETQYYTLSTFPTDEYTFIAKSPTSGNELARTTITIIEGESVDWVISE